MLAREDEIARLIRAAAAEARRETGDEPEEALTQSVDWPVHCTVGPGLEGAIACESKVGYVNGSKGWLVYRGYDIFDLCAYSSFEQVTYLLLHGELPSATELQAFKSSLVSYGHLPSTLRRMMSFPIERMVSMRALRLGISLSHLEFTTSDQASASAQDHLVIASDEDSIAMETEPAGFEHAVYEFRRRDKQADSVVTGSDGDPSGLDACYRLIAGSATIAAAIGRLRNGLMPIEPDPELGYAANFLYMLTGRRPTPVEERVMDACLILHADHGMNASTFAAMVVASTQADVYFSVGAGIGALSGPLHGGANELVVKMLREIGTPANVLPWYAAARAEKRKIPGFGHRVYKAYDPRARVLGPLARLLAQSNEEVSSLLATAEALERVVIADLGVEKSIFPNVDFYSGIVYAGLGIAPEIFTPIFAVSRVAGWTARVQEYLERSRIFRPRAVYTGPLGKCYPRGDAVPEAVQDAGDQRR